MRRITTFNFCGQERTVAFTVAAAEMLDEKAGSLEQLGEWLAGDGGQMAALGRCVEIVQLLMAEGENYERLQARYSGQERKDLAVPTAEELKSLYTVQDLATLKDVIFGAISAGQQQEVESKAVEATGKNENATS